jgi:hypothetical protein
LNATRERRKRSKTLAAHRRAKEFYTDERKRKPNRQFTVCANAQRKRKMVEKERERERIQEKRLPNKRR